MSFAYLASPYTAFGPEKLEIEQKRYEDACVALVWLLAKRQWAYAPIVHCHDISRRFQLPGHFMYWDEYNRVMLASASEMIVLMLDGWKESKGIASELAYAKKLGLRVYYMRPIEAYYKLSESP